MSVEVVDEYSNNAAVTVLTVMLFCFHLVFMLSHENENIQNPDNPKARGQLTQYICKFVSSCFLDDLLIFFNLFFLPCWFSASGLRIVLLGGCEDKNKALGNFIIQTEAFYRPFQNKHCEVAHGEWRKKLLSLVKTPNVFSLSVKTVREEMRRCVDLCSPGPNVLLLLVKPSDFMKTKEPSSP